MRFNLKSFFSKKNMPTLLFSLIIILILYYVYIAYFKEGFESLDLDEETKKGKQLVLFYADWCGHCKKIKPVWDEASDEINDKDKNKKMIKINCGGGSKKEKEIMEKYNIDGYPTKILFTNGKPSPYEGARNKDAFIEALS